MDAVERADISANTDQQQCYAMQIRVKYGKFDLNVRMTLIVMR